MTPTTPAAAPASGITDLAKNQLTTLLRKLILVGTTAALAHHVDSATVNAVSALFDPGAIAGEVMAAATVLWSLYANKRHNTKLVIAAATGATTATASQSDTVMLLKSGILPVKPISAAREAASTAPLAVPPAPPAA